MINGEPYIPIRWSVNKNGHGAADDASITLSIKNNPDFSVQLFQTGNSDFVPVPIAIYAGFPTNPQAGSLSTTGMSLRFIGNADLYTADVDGNEVTFTGRSLAAPMLDTKLTSAPMNMTAPQFAQAYATRLGLTLNVLLEDPNEQPVTIQQMLGREYIGGPQLNAFVYNLHPWDILLKCALFDDVDVWVDNNTLNYVAPTKVQRTVCAIAYGQFLMAPKLSHSVLFNKNIRVEVRSYQHHSKIATVYRAEGDASSGVTVTSSSKYVVSAPVFGTTETTSTTISPTGQTTTVSSSSGGKTGATTGSESESNRQVYTFYPRNLNPAKCSSFAQSMWRQLSAQEYSMEFSVMMTPSILSQLSISSLLKITGLPYSNFNRAGSVNDGYYPRKLVETYDPASGGWDVSVTCINLQPAAQAV
jgi:hypothetical protein